jgi:hypothetical protein
MTIACGVRGKMGEGEDDGDIDGFTLPCRILDAELATFKPIVCQMT